MPKFKLFKVSKLRAKVLLQKRMYKTRNLPEDPHTITHVHMFLDGRCMCVGVGVGCGVGARCRMYTRVCVRV